MRKHYSFFMLVMALWAHDALCQIDYIQTISFRVYLQGNALSYQDGVRTIQKCPTGTKPYFYLTSPSTVVTIRNLKTNFSDTVTDYMPLDTGSYELSNSMNSTPDYLNVENTAATTVSAGTLSGPLLRNDTLYLCKATDNWITFTLSVNDVSCVKTISDLVSGYGDSLFVNGTNMGPFETAIKSPLLKSGDILKLKIKAESKYFNGMCCVKDNGNAFTQQITLQFVDNGILPAPIITQGDYSCPGDTIWLKHTSNDPSVVWGYCCYPSQLYAKENGTAYIFNTRYIHGPDSFLVSLSSTTTLHGCSLISPAATVHLLECGYSKATGNIREISSGKPISNVLVRIKNSQDYAFSDYKGFYSITLTDRNYYRPKTVEIASTDYYRSERGIWDTTVYSRDNDLYTYKLLSSDLAISSSSGRFRPGFTVPIFFHITNQGKNANAGTLTVHLDNALTFASASKTPKSINGNTLTFDIDSLVSCSTGTLTIHTTLLASTALGNTLTNTASLVASKTDVNLGNNATTLTSTVVGSYDPNDIEVTPKGIGQYGYITDKDSLHYTIRFQNMGTDTAFTVVVKAKIPNGLDFSSFLMKGASHPYQLSIQHDTLVWTFAHIKLPHKAINEPGSHGLIRFFIKQKPSNPVNTEIRNKAAIYFDYNAPVITNEVLNMVNNGMVTDLTLEEIEHGAARLYPNPNDGHFVFESTEAGMLKIYDALGNAVYSQSHSGRLAIDMSTLPKGIYYYHAEGLQSSKKGKIVLR